MADPRKISDRISSLRAIVGDALPPDAEGAAANFNCGSYIRFLVQTGKEGRVDDLRYQTNGCGYMAAAADILAENIRGNDTRELHGLEAAQLSSYIEDVLDVFPPDRRHCLDAVIEAVHNAFADLRRRQVEEFRGESALICTCFGVTEERIEDVIKSGATSVGQITAATNAGRGCGSCRMLIQDILDLKR